MAQKKKIEVPNIRAQGSWIEIEFLDEFGKPVPNAEYSILLANGREVHGKLDENGLARVDEVAPGAFWVNFPEHEEYL